MKSFAFFLLRKYAGGLGKINGGWGGEFATCGGELTLHLTCIHPVVVCVSSFFSPPRCHGTKGQSALNIEEGSTTSKKKGKEKMFPSYLSSQASPLRFVDPYPGRNAQRAQT
jgi:hypothetical protein